MITKAIVTTRPDGYQTIRYLNGTGEWVTWVGSYSYRDIDHSLAWLKRKFGEEIEIEYAQRDTD